MGVLILKLTNKERKTMSKREREYGVIDFTKTGYSEITRKVRTEYNTYIVNLKDKAIKIYHILSELPNKERAQAFEDMISHANLSLRGFNTTYEHIELVKKELFRGAKGRLTKPRAISFKKITNKEKEFDIYCDEGNLSFVIKGNSGFQCIWDTDYGNKNVRSAHMTKTYKIISKILSEHKWRRGEGGEWYYTDENDECSFDNSGDSISRTFNSKY